MNCIHFSGFRFFVIWPSLLLDSLFLLVSLSKSACPAIPKISALFWQVSANQLQKSEAEVSAGAWGYFCVSQLQHFHNVPAQIDFVSPISSLLRKEADIKKELNALPTQTLLSILGLFLSLDSLWGGNITACSMEAFELLLFWSKALSVTTKKFYSSLVSATLYFVCRQPEQLQSQKSCPHSSSSSISAQYKQKEIKEIKKL